ncbi:LacI family DNA-binding transcriptional regulator [Galbitalea sp. SE-J8]|uniref:LacI family DNA-binding transcriptional regulator n=1 Tax=Galbitalea sp. SE-J8 TaxID=3054952 RepID=UPI00259D27B8|nr:LacI family DNA-binding transcriptional regulator [Galbitalea sp. SE-J8]MDM4762145.1 LacI family DNA-binding transcriptional regulator [Galbitalea sp. SE-J8]
MPRVRLEDVARVAGVSMKTVSNVVRDYPHVSAATRQRVESAIAALGYRPNISARQLATGRTGMIALAFSDVSLPYFAELARVVAHAAGERGFRVLLEQTDADLDRERQILSAREAGLVDGLLFQPARMSSAEIAEHRQDLPLVLLGEESAPITVDRVMIDNPAAAAEATRHLLALGRRRLGFVGHEVSGLSRTSTLRLAGFQSALEGAGLAVDPALLVATDEISARSAAQAVGAALASGVRVDGFVCRDDLAAIGTVRAVHEAGLRVPHDIAITGWDDISLASMTHPSITSVAPDVRALVETALDLLADRLGGFDGLGRHQLIGHRLVVRESAPAVA